MRQQKGNCRFRLIATLGTEPQVITSTIDLLLQRGVLISSVVVIHTGDNGGPISSAIATLNLEYFQSPYKNQFELGFVSIRGENGEELRDVETYDSSRAAFLEIYKQVRIAKLDGDYVHLSIAGGRKTMSAFGMVTAQLLFDEEDHLWHLYSSGDFLASKRLHPQPHDDVRLIPIPFILWSQISPSLTNIIQEEDPLQAIENIRQLQLNKKIDNARSYILNSLTASERKVTALLVRDGLSDKEIADRLSISPRTVEQHLRSAYIKAANHWELENVNRTQLVSLLNIYYVWEMDNHEK